MNAKNFNRRNAHRALGVLLLGAALIALGCDANVHYSNPTTPVWPGGSGAGLRSLEISATLEAEDGGCFQATVLYDGVEIFGSRSRCSQAQGCARLDLVATTLSEAGHHTVSFKVLRQSDEAIDYVVEGTVRVSRENLNLGGVILPLGPKHARLEEGGVVTFDFELSDLSN